jgi:alpha-L-fucosidase 2
MKTTRRRFLQTTTATAAVGLPAISTADKPDPDLEGFEIARRHTIVRDLPTPNFFEGMLLGNGDVGVCVTVRPDALGLHLGKLDAWDIRVSEDHAQHVVPFSEILKMWERASTEAKRQGKPEMLYLESNIDFFREYTRLVSSSYAKPWPRPWPCGRVWIRWDSRWLRVARQSLNPSNGFFTLDLVWSPYREQSRPVRIVCFVDWDSGLVSLSSEMTLPMLSATYESYADAENPLPFGEMKFGSSGPTGEFTYTQRLPATAPTAEVPDPPPSEKDRILAVHGILSGSWIIQDQEETSAAGTFRRVVSFESSGPQPLRFDLMMRTSRDHADPARNAAQEVQRLAAAPVEELQRETEVRWRGFWSRSAVEFEDKELERIWYHNQYFLACCLREGRVCPGLFGNWTSGKIGTAWHGDYHMNYNTQQVFWGVFSSNHVDQHFPYVDLVEKLLPMSEAFARDHFGLPGAFFPHSAYPVPSQVMPYPVPPWGYEVCETPWTVQSVWWHYLYTLDRDFLKRAYPLLRAAARFLAAYVKKGDDGKFHIIPTVSPENWGFTVDFRLNKDCIMDLALTEFLFDAVIEASKTLDVDEGERTRWAEIRENLASYPKATGPYGEVWLDVPGAPTEWVYNVPVTLAPVFPGEQVGIGRGAEHHEIARRTAETIRLEGGNDLVYQPLIRARLGILDLEWFKREVRYCLLPNGVANDRVRQVGGRYDDSTDFDFMMRMGVWTENLSLPAVLNECMMQSWTGVIRLFPNTRGLGPARFQNLRTVGAFLVSASYDGAKASNVTIFSERGSTVRLANPWPDSRIRVRRAKDESPIEVNAEGETVEFQTLAGESYLIDSI